MGQSPEIKNQKKEKENYDNLIEKKQNRKNIQLIDKWSEINHFKN